MLLQYDNPCAIEPDFDSNKIIKEDCLQDRAITQLLAALPEQAACRRILFQLYSA